MSDPGPLPVQQALDQIDALVVQVRGLMERVDDLDGRLATLECVRRIDDHLGIGDWMSRDGIGGA